MAQEADYLSEGWWFDTQLRQSIYQNVLGQDTESEIASRGCTTEHNLCLLR